MAKIAQIQKEGRQLQRYRLQMKNIYFYKIELQNLLRILQNLHKMKYRYQEHGYIQLHQELNWRTKEWRMKNMKHKLHSC